MSGNLFKKDIIPVEKIEASKAVKVQQEIIYKILEVYPNIEYVKLGSVGKKNGYNGDIDIGIKAKDINELYNIIHSVFNYTDTVKSESLYIISIKYQYEENKYVAVDFIQVVDIEYTKFRYYCPDYTKNESKYKVGTKIMFIGTILNHCKEDILYNIPDYRAKYLFLPTGLYLSLWNYTDNTSTHVLATLDPQDVVDIMFENETVDVCNTVESLWKAIHSDKFKYPQEVKAIELSFFVNSYRKGWEELVKPEDFELQYWTLEEINERLKPHTLLRKINMLLI